MIDAWRAFGRLHPARRRLLVEAAALQVAVVIGLRVCSFPRLRRALQRIATLAPASPSSAVAHHDVSWAIGAAGRRLPFRPTCLVDALAAHAMLARRRHAPAIRLGVRRGERFAPLAAHAWVECEGRTVVGRTDDFDGYLPLQERSAG